LREKLVRYCINFVGALGQNDGITQDIVVAIASTPNGIAADFRQI